MKVEHLTLGGNAVIRDTSSILPTTRWAVDALQIGYTSKIVTIPKLPFKLRITTVEEGAAFDIIKGEQTAVSNYCCFEEEYSSTMLSNIEQIVQMFQQAGINWKVVEPVTPQWLYSVVINPSILSATELTTAGEVELYVFEQLLIAKLKAR